MHFFFFTVYKNERKEYKYWRQKKSKSEFYKNKKVFQIDYIDVNKILVSKKEPYGTNRSFKYFIGYNDNDVIRPLYVRLTGYARRFDENAAMSFKANNEEILKNYNKIWKNVEKVMKIDFESKAIYVVDDDDDDKYIKTKKIYMQAVWLQIFVIKKWLKKKHRVSVYQ